MPVEIVVISSQFYNQLKSKYNFVIPSQPTNNLVGSIGERIYTKLVIDVRWYFESNASNLITITGGGTKLERQYGSWLDDGFCVGDTFSLYYYDSLGGYHGLYTGTISNVSDLVLIPTATIGVSNGGYSIMTIYGTTALTSLTYRFGLIENNETFNILSKVSNNEQAYYASNIVHSPPLTLSNMLKLGNYKDWIGGMGNADVNTASVYFFSRPSAQYQRFVIGHDFIISPFYLEEYKNNFEDNTVPELYEGSNSLKYVFECEFRTLLSDPNTAKTKRVENILGSVGWFNQNFNGFNNDYSIDSIVYSDISGNTSDGIMPSTVTKAIITIKSTSAFNALEPSLVYFSLCPESIDYINKTTNLEYNFLFDDLILYEGSAPSTNSNNGIIYSGESHIVGSDLVLTVYFTFSTTQQIQIKNGYKYIIGIQVANDTLVSGNSNKVMLLADYNDFDSSPDIPDLLLCTDFRIHQHFEMYPTTTSGTSKIDLWNEDGVCLMYDFCLDLSKKSVINSLKSAVIAYNATTEDYFILDEYAINLNDVIISSGIQQINVDATRGYKLEDTDYFNRVLLTTETLVSQLQYYRLYIGQKVSWQKWIKNNNADSIFYDSTEENNNLNYKSSNYSTKNGYEIKFALIANVYGESSLGVTGDTDYLLLSTDITVHDYEEPTDWTITLETFDELGTTNLNGSILTNANTLMKITWVKDTSFNSGYNFWAIHRIEESGEAGTDIYEFSSIIPSIINNLLVPLSGETFLKITEYPLTNTIITECLIDYTKIANGTKYKLSARLDDGTAAPISYSYKITEDGKVKITEDGQIKVIE